MVDYNTDKLLIAHYPCNTGGKFLLNCLALSTGCVLQHARLAQMQIKNRFRPELKFKFLLRRLQKIRNDWDDLGLGCRQLFGTTNWTDNAQIPQEKIRPIISILSRSQTLFPIVSHTFTELCGIVDFWPNARLLRIINYQRFIERYRPRHSPQALWDTIRESSWPITVPETEDQYHALPDHIRQKVQSTGWWIAILSHLDIPWQQQQIVEDMFASQNSITWDASWILDSNTFVDNMRQVYDRLQLPHCNVDHLIEFRTQYIQRLDYFRDRQAH